MQHEPDTINEPDIKALSKSWVQEATRMRGGFKFSTWMGRPIIQLPQDMMAMQEIIWRMRPDLIVETGIAHGGSLIYYASLLELVGGEATVLGVDIDIRAHNREAIEAHPMARRIQMIQGSSIDAAVVAEVFRRAEGAQRVLVVLDSNHTHEHVLAELELYAPLVKKDGYIVVYDTAVEDMPKEYFPDRPWGPGDNPKTAVWEFLKRNDRFEIDREWEDKLFITVAPDGYLRCVRD